MSSQSFGFSIILGHPFDKPFIDWIRDMYDRIGVFCNLNSPENLHTTIVNCTFPRARSVASEVQVLLFTDCLRRKLLMNMTQVLLGLQPFELSFERPMINKDGAIILPSKPDRSIAELKARFQGKKEAIPEDQIPDILAQSRTIGIDKYSTQFPTAEGELQPSVSITLGKIGQKNAETIDFNGIPDAPALILRSFRIAFYRDRELNDAVVSDDLEFVAALATIRPLILKFFDQL